MEMYFIDYLQCYSGQNRKGSELQEHVSQYYRSLISSEKMRDTIIQDIIEKINTLNEKYPKVKKLVLSKTETSLVVSHDGMEDRNVFIMSFSRVHRVYTNENPLF